MRQLVSIFIVMFAFISCGKSKTKLTVLFDRVDGLNVGSNVQNKGIKIGEVKKLELYNNQVVADIELNPHTRIPIDSKFTVKNGILSTSTIDAEFSDNKTYLSSGDTVKGIYIQRGLIDELLSDSTKRKQIEASLQKIASGLEDIVETVKKDSVSHK